MRITILQTMPRKIKQTNTLTISIIQNKNIGDLAYDIPTVIAPIKFKYNSSTIKSQSYPLLKQYAKALKTGLRDATIEIGGHTDSKGSWQYNYKLSKRRANAVKRFLINQQVNNRQLKVAAYGEYRFKSYKTAT